MSETMFDDEEDDGTSVDLLDLDLLLEAELQEIPSPSNVVNSKKVECKDDKGRSISIFDDSVEIDFSAYTISENASTADTSDNTSEWTELLQYSSEFINTVEYNLQPPFSDGTINDTRGLTEGSGNEFILSSQSIVDIINSLGSDENHNTLSSSDNRDNFDIEYEVRQTLELMITSVECCAPIYSAVDALPQSVKAAEHTNLHIIEDDNATDSFQVIKADTTESRQQIHEDTMSEMLQQTQLSKNREEQDAASLERKLEMELQQALEQDRQQRRERRLRFEKEAAEALLRKKMAVRIQCTVRSHSAIQRSNALKKERAELLRIQALEQEHQRVAEEAERRQLQQEEL
eukprot:gene41732-56505_t